MSKTISPVLGEATVQELREAVRGEVLTPQDPGYAEAAPPWNGAHAHRTPALVVRCAGTADVMAAVAFARSNDLPVAVRGGGHSIAGFSTTDGGIVVDLGPIDDVRVDLATGRATVGGGAVWGDVDHESQAFGLATTGGLISTTGVAGYTLGGGIGWLMRAHGLACDNLLAADVVTADGRFVHASESENADLLWGLRGGGGNFGIVTRFELQLHPVGPLVYAGPVFYPAAAARDLLRAFRDWAPSAPDEITALVNLTTAPPLPVIPERWHGEKVCALVGLAIGPPEDAPALVEGLRGVAEPIADLLGPMPYTVMQTLLDPLWQKGTRAYFKASNLATLDDGLIDALCERHLRAPGPLCEVHVHQMGGAVARVGEGATAFAERSMPYVLNAVAGWQSPADDAAHVAWVRDVSDATVPSSTGRAYVNYLSDPDLARSSYGEETYARLAALKSEYDPTNLFRLNQNVRPAAGE